MIIKKIFLLANFALVIFVINSQIWHKEETLAQGELILLELAPVDPRSLLQGDYMRLNYAITRSVDRKNIPTRGYIILSMDKDRVARMERIQEEGQPLNQGEYAVRYYYHDWDLFIGAESFFFQEGQAQKYEKAKYGALKVAQNGESILIGLYDEKHQLIQ